MRRAALETLSVLTAAIQVGHKASLFSCLFLHTVTAPAQHQQWPINCPNLVQEVRTSKAVNSANFPLRTRHELAHEHLGRDSRVYHTRISLFCWHIIASRTCMEGLSCPVGVDVCFRWMERQSTRQLSKPS